MAKGRKPKPSALKLRLGNPGGRPLPADPNLSQTPACPDPPDILDRAALEEYRRVGDILVAARVLTTLDLAILTAYAQAYSAWLNAVRHVAEDGEVLDGPNGGQVVNQWVYLAKTFRQQMLSSAAELGLTPVARARVNKVEGDAGDDLENRLLG